MDQNGWREMSKKDKKEKCWKYFSIYFVCETNSCRTYKSCDAISGATRALKTLPLGFMPAAANQFNFNSTALQHNQRRELSPRLQSLDVSLQALIFFYFQIVCYKAK